MLAPTKCSNGIGGLLDVPSDDERSWPLALSVASRLDTVTSPVRSFSRRGQPIPLSGESPRNQLAEHGWIGGPSRNRPAVVQTLNSRATLNNTDLLKAEH